MNNLCIPKKKLCFEAINNIISVHKNIIGIIVLLKSLKLPERWPQIVAPFSGVGYMDINPQILVFGTRGAKRMSMVLLVQMISNGTSQRRFNDVRVTKKVNFMNFCWKEANFQNSAEILLILEFSENTLAICDLDFFFANYKQK